MGGPYQLPSIVQRIAACHIGNASDVHAVIHRNTLQEIIMSKEKPKKRAQKSLKERRKEKRERRDEHSRD